MAKLDPASEAVIVSRWPWVLGLLAALGLVLFLLEPILLPFVLGALIAYLGDPLVDLLEERNLGRTLGVCIVFVLFGTLIVTALIVAVPNLIEQLDGGSIAAAEAPHLSCTLTTKRETLRSRTPRPQA